MQSYCIQAKRVGFQHRLRSVGGILTLHIMPGLPASHVSQPPAAQVRGRLCPVGAPSPSQLPWNTILTIVRINDFINVLRKRACCAVQVFNLLVNWWVGDIWVISGMLTLFWKKLISKEFTFQKNYRMSRTEICPGTAFTSLVYRPCLLYSSAKSMLIKKTNIGNFIKIWTKT